MMLYRVECLITIVLVNHWKTQWVIPGNAGVQVPQYFLQYAQTLPLRHHPMQDPIQDQEQVAYHRVDVSLPPALFDAVCLWLHTGAPLNLSGYDKETTMPYTTLLNLLIKPWKLPVPFVYVGDFDRTPLKSIVEEWNEIQTSLQSADGRRCLFRGSQPCFAVLQERLRNEDELPLMPDLWFYVCQDFSISGIELFCHASSILKLRDTILQSSDVWALSKPSIPDEVQSIAQIIALTKKIPIDQALTQCLQQPLDPSEAFWSDIESHIGQTSWQLLRKIHQEGHLDARKPTFDDFLDTLPQPLDDPSREMVHKAFAWAEAVDQLTKPNSEDTKKQLNAPHSIAPVCIRNNHHTPNKA